MEPIPKSTLRSHVIACVLSGCVGGFLVLLGIIAFDQHRPDFGTAFEVGALFMLAWPYRDIFVLFRQHHLISPSRNEA